MRNNLSAGIKKILRANKVENKVSTYGSTITVKCLSRISQDVCDQIKSMETADAHGDIMDDTRYYTGLSIQFDYSWELTDKEKSLAKEAVDSWSDNSKVNRVDFSYHIKKQLNEKYGPTGKIMAHFLGYY